MVTNASQDIHDPFEIKLKEEKKSGNLRLCFVQLAPSSGY